MNKLYYSGIGSRETPKEIRQAMCGIASFAESKGLILRSGGAEGADEAFESGVTDEDNKQIYVPWYQYNKHRSQLCFQSDEDFLIASYYHPKWKNLRKSTKQLHARNVQIVLGPYPTRNHSRFVVCWTPDGAYNHTTRTKETGGTGMGISIASSRYIPVFNLFYEQAYRRVFETIMELSYENS